MDPRNASLLAGRITGAQLVTFPGLGHLVFWEDPDGFAAVVTSFLLDTDDTKRPYPKQSKPGSSASTIGSPRRVQCR